MQINVKRVYDPPSPTDGCRVLVDRLWPRGLATEVAAVDHWAKDLAPSTDLRKWYHSHADRHDEFVRRYQAEFVDAAQPFQALLEATARCSVVTLLYASRDTEHTHAYVVRRWLENHRQG